MRMFMLLSSAIVFCAFLAAGAPSVFAQGADLTKIDRTIAKEPVYKTKPKYCLLVFGPNAESRVWLVLDGDVLYVDRNGNGDLTEPGEWMKQVRATDRTGFQIDELSLPDNAFPKNSSGLWLYRDTPMRFGITINQKTWFGTVKEFADRPKDAPILHFNFNGPLTFVCLDPPTFVPGRTTKLLIHIGTPGLGEKARVWRHASPIVGFEVGLLVEIEYPNKNSGGKPIFAKHILPLAL